MNITGLDCQSGMYATHATADKLLLSASEGGKFFPSGQGDRYIVPTAYGNERNCLGVSTDYFIVGKFF